MLLPCIGSSENGQTESEATPAKHSIVVVANVATGRSDLWTKRYKQFGNVHVATEGAALRTGLSIDCLALNDGRLHGQGTKVHRNGTRTNRKATKSREQTDFIRFPHYIAGAYHHVPIDYGQ